MSTITNKLKNQSENFHEPLKTATLLNISLSLAQDNERPEDILKVLDGVVGSQYDSALERLVLALADEGKVEQDKFELAIKLLELALIKKYINKQNFEFLVEKIEKRSGRKSEYKF